jgi:tetratricopeptide (TPR) repeat protein
MLLFLRRWRSLVVWFLVGLVWGLSCASLVSAQGLSCDQFAHPSSLDGVRSTASTHDLIDQGRQLSQSDRFGAAVQVWRQALQDSAASDPGTALIWSYLAAAYEQMGQWQQAQQAITRSLQALEQTPNSSRLRAQILTTQGHLELVQNPTMALDLRRQAEVLYWQSADTVGQLGSQINQVRALEAIGFYRQARSQLQAIQQELETLDHTNLENASLKAIAARQALEQSLATAEAADLTEAAASTLLSLGNTAQSQGNWPAALDYYRQAETRAETGAGAIQLQAAVSELGLLTRLKHLHSDPRFIEPSEFVNA